MIKFYFITIVTIILYLFIEYILLSTSIKKIPKRILVNGTRGKSTTVKIIYNILRKSELKVYAKITGDIPILLTPDGLEIKLKRFAPASIKENIKILRKISKNTPDAVVMECMALQSENQSMLGNTILKPHFVLIVNVLPDHKEVMGETIEENLTTLLKCVNKESILFTTESTKNILQNFKLDNTTIETVKSIELNNNFENIPQDIITESWSIIKGLTDHLKIDDQIAKDEFLIEWQAINTKIRANAPNSNIDLWNLFSVNDISTADKFIKCSLNQNKDNKRIFILNARIDRPIRTKEFIQYIVKNFSSSEIWLMGNGKFLAKSILLKNKFSEEKIFILCEEKGIIKLHDSLSNNTTLYCLGNYKGTYQFLAEVKKLINGKGVLN